MKATEQCFPVVLFIMLYKVVLTFESVDEILKCDHSKKTSGTEQYFPVVLVLYKVVRRTFQMVMVVCRQFLLEFVVTLFFLSNKKNPLTY